MPQNLDSDTRNIILKCGSCSIAVLSTASLYAQVVVIPRLRSNPIKSKLPAWTSPPLLLGCLGSLALMLIASALLTQTFILSSRKDYNDDSFISRDLSSSINFCEEDFADSDYIAEPANTASSLASYCPLALLGMYGTPRKEWSSRIAGQKRFAIAYIALMAIGLGSTTLHALLTANAQGGDELPMLRFMACLAFCAIDIIIKGNAIPPLKNNNGRWLHWGVSTSVVVATALYTMLRGSFVFFYIMFLLYCWVAIAGIITICFVLKWNDDTFRANVLLPLAVCTAWTAIFALMAWLSELVLCKEVTHNFVFGTGLAPWIWNRAVHPLWHCSSALVAWVLIQILLACQGLQRGWGEPRLRWYGAPYVTFYKPNTRIKRA